MDLLTCSIDYFALTADILSKRLHAPAPEKLNNTLTLEDAGYFDRARMMNIEKNGGVRYWSGRMQYKPCNKVGV
jgi:hypothetical protein